jgi:co-chaperonin GroES (HSP10)
MVKPRKNQVLVKRDQHTEEVTKGGLHLPPTTLLNAPPRTTGIIVALGPDVQGLSKGDRVIFPEHAGHRLHYKEMAHLILDDHSILATFEENDKVK